MNEFDVADAIRRELGIEPWWPAVEPSTRWVRVRLGDHVVADSRRTQLLIQYGPPPMLPTYFFPLEDVDPSSLVNELSVGDGSARWDVAADGHSVDDGAWTHPRSTGRLAPIDGMVTFSWMSELQWFEEDESVFAHARDPHKRVDVASSSRHVQVKVSDTVVAESTRPLLLFETTLPTRFYLPNADVRTELLESSSTVSQCPYKGTAQYWSLRLNGETLTDIAWSYADPVPENPRIKGLIAFFNERVDLIVDGQPMERTRTPWS